MCWNAIINRVLTTITNVNIDERIIVFSDNGKSYLYTEYFVEIHVYVKLTNKTTDAILNCVHVVISNAKRTLSCVYLNFMGSIHNYILMIFGVE